VRRPGLTAAVVAALPLLLGIDLLRSKSRAVEEGNAQMKAGKAEEALGRYDQAAERLPNDPGVRFNRGTALFGLGRYDEAAQEFLRATETKGGALRASAFYNLGNSFFQAQKYGEAIEAYKRALAFDPSDARAKWNLEIALRKKREQDEQKKQDQKNDQQKQDQKNDQQKQDQKNGEQKPDDGKPQNDDPDPKSDQPPKPEDKNDENGKNGEQPDQKKPGDQDGQGKDPDKQNAAPDEPPPNEPPPNGQPEGGRAGEDPARAELREIDAVLDSLERSPKALEKERARLRAVRRRPPAKDW
jgi:tetratricopeptide (TPR) repeat protein